MKFLVVRSFFVARVRKICEHFITCFCLLIVFNFLLNNLLMNFSSCPTMKNMNVHDLHFDEYFLTFLGHDNSSIGNVQEAYHMEPKNPLVVEVMHDDASIHH